MKALFQELGLLLFVILSNWAPLIIIPLLAYQYGNWYLLFGILFYYVVGAGGPLFTYFTILCIPVWIMNGFSIHQYITFYFFCALCGLFFMHIIGEVLNQLNAVNVNVNGVRAHLVTKK